MIKKICATILIFAAMSFSITFASMPAEHFDTKALNLEERMLNAAVFDNSRYCRACFNAGFLHFGEYVFVGR